MLSPHRDTATATATAFFVSAKMVTGITLRPQSGSTWQLRTLVTLIF
jgi:hypothetical protein